MKTLKHLAFMLLLAGIFCACSNDDNEDIVGNYRVVYLFDGQSNQEFRAHIQPGDSTVLKSKMPFMITSVNVDPERRCELYTLLGEEAKDIQQTDIPFEPQSMSARGLLVVHKSEQEVWIYADSDITEEISIEITSRPTQKLGKGPLLLGHMKKITVVPQGN